MKVKGTGNREQGTGNGEQGTERKAKPVMRDGGAK